MIPSSVCRSQTPAPRPPSAPRRRRHPRRPAPMPPMAGPSPTACAGGRAHRRRGGQRDGEGLLGQVRASAPLMAPPPPGPPAVTRASDAWANDDHVRAGERGHRAGHPRHLVQPSGAQAAGAQLGRREVRRRRGPAPVRQHVRRARARAAADAAGDCRGCLSRRVRQRAHRGPDGRAARRGRNGPAAAPRCAADSGHGRPTCSVHAPSYTPSPHGQGFMAATRRKAAGKVDGPAGTADPDDPFLERLAQRLEGGDGELPELVEEEDRRGWPGSPRPAAATSCPRRPGRRWRPGGAERGTEGAAPSTPSGSAAAGCGVDAGHRRAPRTA